MLKKFFKDSAIYTFGTILTRGIQIIMLPLYTRLLSKADYGTLDLFLIIGSIVNVTVAFEINQGFGRHYSESSTEEDKLHYSSTALWFVIFAYTIFFLLSQVFAEPINRIFIDNNSPIELFRIAMVLIFASGIFLFLQNQLRWYLKSKQFTVTGIVFTIVSYGITIILLSRFNLKVEGVFIGFITGYIVSGILSFYFSSTNYKFKFDLNKLREMLAYSLPLVPSAVGTVVLLYIDRFAINKLMTIADVGTFGVAYRFASIVTIVLSGFQTAFAPLIFKSYKEKNTPAEVERVFRYFLIITLSFITALSLFAKEALVIFTTYNYFDAQKIIPLISFAVLFFSMNMFTPGLALAKKTKYIAIINISGALLNLVLNFLLIPVLGLIGAALSTLISSITIFIVNMAASQNDYPINYKWLKILSAFFIAIVIIFVSKVIDALAPGIILREAGKIILLCLSLYMFVIVLMGENNFKIALSKVVGFIKSKYVLK